ncbi:MAG: hypothetical protein JWQ16_2634 [Novosphingobium sp.]|nr:hypothetical protein [Novosphingobium sp.]
MRKAAVLASTASVTLQNRRAEAVLSRLHRDTSAVALVEFAFAMPLLMVFMSSGLELVNYVIAVKQIGEISVMVADNASRMGAQSANTNKPISEAEINDVFIGADLQGSGLSMSTNSRIILSSLQQNATGGQTIKWQRCFGTYPHASSYGVQGDGASNNSFPGMGPASNRVTASAGTAVMVVEVTYHYRRLVPIIQLPLRDITETTAFNVRDSRDLTQVYNTEAVTVSSC